MKTQTFAQKLHSAVFTRCQAPNVVVVAAVTEEGDRKRVTELGRFTDPKLAIRHRQAVIDAVMAVAGPQAVAA